MNVKRTVKMLGASLLAGIVGLYGARDLDGLAPVQSLQEPDPVTFVVLGHVRGDRDRGLNHLLEELLDEVERIGPDFAVLTGDLVWGDPRSELADKTPVAEEFDRLDEALARLGVPLYRVPGNHDVGDEGTFELFVDRYGALPRHEDIGGLRLILLNTAWHPERGERATTRGFNLGEGQVAAVREALADPSQYSHAFVFMHNIHFWQEPHEPWWTEVHPLLANGGVRAVFTGDYGPEKFSYTSRDGVDYYQSGIAPNPSLGILQGHEWNRLLAQQFDNFLEVTVSGDNVDVEVHTVGEVTTGHFTPDLWRAVWGRITRRPAEGPGGFERLAAFLETGKAKLFTAGVLGLVLLGGIFLGRLSARRR